MTEQDRNIALHALQLALGLIEHRHPEVEQLAKAAQDRPTPDALRRLLVAGHGKAWQRLLVDALAQVGIAAAETIGDGS